MWLSVHEPVLWLCFNNMLTWPLNELSFQSLQEDAGTQCFVLHFSTCVGKHSTSQMEKSPKEKSNYFEHCWRANAKPGSVGSFICLRDSDQHSPGINIFIEAKHLALTLGDFQPFLRQYPHRLRNWATNKHLVKFCASIQKSKSNFYRELFSYHVQGNTGGISGMRTPELLST